MSPVNQKILNAVLARSGLQAKSLSSPVGREISYRDGPLRLIIIHLLAADPLRYTRNVVSAVLRLDDQWFLTTRYGPVNHLGLVAGEGEIAAIKFEVSESQKLVDYLCSRSMDIGSTSTDLYLIGDQGKVLVTWDHHTTDEGLVVALKSVSDNPFTF